MASFVETSGSLTNTTATFAAKSRNGLIIGNPSDTVMTVSFGGTASATVGIPVPAGESIALLGHLNAPDGAVSLFCAGTAKAYTVEEW